MSSTKQDPLAVTREKLRLLEENYERAKADTSGSTHQRQLELRSLKQLINRLKEEITRAEAHAAAR
jgi:hypothetical protein